MVKATSHSESDSSTFAPRARTLTHELERAQARALVAHIAANPKLDVHRALSALVLRLQQSSEQLNAAERKILSAVDARVAAEWREQPEQWKRDYAELLTPRRTRARSSSRGRECLNATSPRKTSATHSA